MPNNMLPQDEQSPDKYRQILRNYWGYDDFRGVQREIIESIGAGHDTLGLMPTGGGKSITFQVPAMAMEGVCLVITPLISLMKDQVANLRSHGIMAGAVYTGLMRTEVLTCLDNCIFGGYKFLYVSPERLTSELFLTKLRKMRICFITVDEAHCISHWGYDFRPSYLRIADIREQLPGVPVLALTATATPLVVDDIQLRLGFATRRVYSMSFARPNLAYRVVQTRDKIGEMLRLLRRTEGSAIVYTRSRKNTREMAELLEGEGISALHYHAGLTNLDKDVRQKVWSEGKVRVMVATNAFGMGIDKPDVRTVIHLDVPDSLEAYFQEAGRAGRDGNDAVSFLLYNSYDAAKLRRRVPDAYPDLDYIRTIYDRLAYYFQLAYGDGYGITYEFDLINFCRIYRYFPIPVISALNILTRAGAIVYADEEENSSRVMFVESRDALYHMRDDSFTTEAVVRALLRLYTGLFSEYSFISEADVAREANIGAGDVYPILTDLTARGILHYIPRKRVAHISYPTRRVMGDELDFPYDVYEGRKSQYIERIESVIKYAESECCRSRMLLEYFGEEGACRCGRCDVCATTAPAASQQLTHREIVADVVAVLQCSAGSMPLQKLSHRYNDASAFAAAMTELIKEEIVRVEGTYVILA